MLVALTIVPLAGAVAIGIAGAVAFDGWLLVFVAVGLALVPVYNLELFGGAIHNGAGFALAWGAFPLLTGYFACAGTITWTALLAAAYATLTSYAQRALSTPVRHLRRRVAAVGGTIELRDGEPRADHARDAGRPRPSARCRRSRPRTSPSRPRCWCSGWRSMPRVRAEVLELVFAGAVVVVFASAVAAVFDRVSQQDDGRARGVPRGRRGRRLGRRSR